MTSAAVRAFILAQQQENDELCSKLTELVSDGPGFKPAERRKGSCRKRGGQPSHPGAGPELLPIERVDEVVEHHPDACRGCGTLLEGQDSAPLRHQVIKIPPITLLLIKHRLRRLVCPCCFSSTCIPLPAAVETSKRSGGVFHDNLVEGRIASLRELPV